MSLLQTLESVVQAENKKPLTKPPEQPGVVSGISQTGGYSITTPTGGKKYNIRGPAGYGTGQNVNFVGAGGMGNITSLPGRADVPEIVEIQVIP